MRRLLEIFKQQINTPTTTTALIAVASLSFAIILYLGQTHIAPGIDNIATKPVTDTLLTKRIGDTFATEPDAKAITTKPVGNVNPAKFVVDAMLANSVDEATVIKPAGDAAANEARSDLVPTAPIGDGLASDPVSYDSATKPADGSIATKPVGDATAPINEPIGTKRAGGSIVNKPIGDAIATKLGSDTVAIKKAAPIYDSINEWQDWQYCLAPSSAEHKIYLSGPIPMIGILGRADAPFHEILNKAGISHDEVQCPKAPNKRTLLFRQRYAIRLNEEIGNTIFIVNWEPDID
jgi:hypothetical protein